MQHLKAFTIFTLISIVYLACKNPSTNSNADDSESIPEITGHIPKNTNARYVTSAQGKLKSQFIRGHMVSYAIIEEYDSSKKMLNETRWNNSTKWTQHYNEGRETKLESFENGSLHIFQENQYNARGHLIQEFRLEYMDDGIDTILYEYHYQYSPDSLYYLAFRTNNSDTVTRYTYEKKGNHIYKVEEAYPYRGFTVINQQEITMNEKGKPTNLLIKRISSDHKNDPLDTIVSSTTYFYDDAGRLIKELNENDFLKANHVRYKYKNGLVSEIILDDETVTYEHYALPKTN